MPKPESANALWDACAGMEAIAQVSTRDNFARLSGAFKLVYELGVEAPTLPSNAADVTDMRIAALFLKRTLNDLRGVWLLLERGYTSQAAAVAASLWENALAAACIAGQPSRAEEVLSSPGALPWTPMDLAQLHASDCTSRISVDAERETAYELRWREHYGGYKWLCKLKHPTLKSAQHDSSSTAMSNNKFVVMAAPDLRPADRGMKLGVATQSLQHAIAAMTGFTEAAHCDDTQRYREWVARTIRAGKLVIEHSQDPNKPALTLDPDEKFLVEYERHRAKSDKPERRAE